MDKYPARPVLLEGQCLVGVFMNVRGSAHAGADEVAFKSSIINFLFKSGLGWLLLALAPFTMGLTLVPIAIVALRYATSSYALDGDRLHLTRGVIFRREEEIELYRVKDVKANFSVIQQIFGVGSLVIISSDATGMSLNARRSFITIPNLSEARALREHIRGLVEEIRTRKNVRELDMA